MINPESDKRHLRGNNNRLVCKREIAGGIALIAVLSLFAYSARISGNYPGEVAFSTWIQSWRPSWLDWFMVGVSILGDEIVAGVILVVVGGWMFIRKHRSVAVLIVTAPIIGFTVRTIVKAAVARPRPSEDLVDIVRAADGYSFPSGHVMHYAVFLGVLLFTMDLEKRRLSWLIRAAAGVVLLMVGLSRVYVGAHWASDVLGGYVFGGGILVLVIWSWRRLGQGRRKCC